MVTANTIALTIFFIVPTSVVVSFPLQTSSVVGVIPALGDFKEIGGRAWAAARGGGVRQRILASRPRFRALAVSSTSSQRTIRERCYFVRNLYATIRATMLAKDSSPGREY